MAEELDLDELIRWYDDQLAAKKLRSENPQVRDLIEVLGRYQNGVGRQFVIDEILKRRRSKGLPIPAKFEESLQSAYNQHSIDSAVWMKHGSKAEEGLFYSPAGKGSGRWAVKRDRAAHWLKSRLIGQ